MIRNLLPSEVSNHVSPSSCRSSTWAEIDVPPWHTKLVHDVLRVPGRQRCATMPPIVRACVVAEELPWIHFRYAELLSYHTSRPVEWKDKKENSNCKLVETVRWIFAIFVCYWILFSLTHEACSWTLWKSTRFKSLSIWVICVVLCKTALAACAKWFSDV